MNNTKEYKLIFFPQLGIYGQVGPTSAEIMTNVILTRKVREMCRKQETLSNNFLLDSFSFKYWLFVVITALVRLYFPPLEIPVLYSGAESEYFAGLKQIPAFPTLSEVLQLPQKS